jgi:hypothetical protein
VLAKTGEGPAFFQKDIRGILVRRRRPKGWDANIAPPGLRVKKVPLAEKTKQQMEEKNGAVHRGERNGPEIK